MSKAVDFFLLNAFTSSPFGGNPAGIVVLDTPFEDDETYRGISANLNQPMHSFVLPPSGSHLASDEERNAVRFGLRWFAAQGEEVPLCGHATLAAAHALFTHYPQLVPQETEMLAFETKHCMFYARRVESAAPSGPPRIQIELPSYDVAPVSDSEFQRISAVVGKALGRKEVLIHFIGIASTGGDASKHFLLIELDKKENLQGSVVNTSALVENKPYVVNILISESSEQGVAYDARMFAPIVGVAEDPVCGSANSVAAPYWMKKKGLPSGKEILAKFVSKRSGYLWLTVDDEKKRLRIKGEVKETAKGQLFL